MIATKFTDVVEEKLCRAAFIANSLLAIDADELDDVLAELPEDVVSEICNAATEKLPCDAARRVAIALCRYELAMLDEQLEAGRFSRRFYDEVRECHVREASRRLRYASRFASNDPANPASAGLFVAGVESELGLRKGEACDA